MFVGLFIIFMLLGYPFGAWLKGSSTFPLPYKFLFGFFAFMVWITLDSRGPSFSGDGNGGWYGSGIVLLIVSPTFGFVLGMAIGAQMRLMKNSERSHDEQ